MPATTPERPLISTIAVIAPGAMGSGVGRRLAEHGIRVLTSLAGRSDATIRRAAAAGMIDAADDAIAGADIILSVLPPGEALAMAERFSSPLSCSQRKPIYVDCNAVNVQTVHRIAAVIAATGAHFVDGAIIGLPPAAAGSPTIYFSGENAARMAALADLGLRIQIMDAPVGAASALKMAYAGINKGVVLLASAVILGATRAGAAEALRAEMAASQSQLLQRLAASIPDMYPKTYRWAPEMLEIAEFLADDPAARDIYQAMAAICQRLAADQAGEQTEIAELDAFIAGIRRTSRPS